MVKPPTVHLVLSLTAIKYWKIHQLDVKNTFLNSVLHETVFITQPPRFKNASFPGAVCKLKKAFYGLKQAPSVWFDRFSMFLFSRGFIASTAGPSLFVLKKNSDLVVLILYVDDILVTGSSSTFLDEFLLQLKKEFCHDRSWPCSSFLGNLG